MKYLLIEDKNNFKYRFNLFAINNNTKYVFNNLFWSANVQDLLLQIDAVQLCQSDFHNSWLDCVITSFDELPTLSYIEQHYPEWFI